jgi:hypothetical protein
VRAERVAVSFELGRPVGHAEPVPGGLSNDLWRLDTDRGAFAVKRMVMHADLPAFVENVEAAFLVEQHAWAAEVAMPEPVADPSTGRALARIDGSLFRVHRWVEARTGSGSPGEVAGLLASIHAAGRARWATLPGAGWTANRWGAELVRLTQRVEGTPPRSVVVDSHGDLDRKNTLRGSDGVLMAVDWDAAGPVSAAQEAVSVALEWSDTDPNGFAEIIDAYVRGSGIAVPAQPWVFAGWVAAQGGWLDANAARHGDTTLGAAEVETTLARLHDLAVRLDALLAALP